ncbi:hypothetical protein TIFTF001_034203 [Ficus carica]|uniref:Uncharacterized protein n=1 Tax=Ficus carica TaxID=3494 RepID=A0AA88E3C0_FICCA|nr:hypothetical protein TIFTF001_034203 [Ficus carica]
MPSSELDQSSTHCIGNWRHRPEPFGGAWRNKSLTTVTTGGDYKIS